VTWSAAVVKDYVESLSPRLERMYAILLLTPGSVLAVLLWQVPATEPLTVSALLIDRVLQALTLFVLPVAVVLVIGGPWWLARMALVAGMIVSVVLGASTSLAATQPSIVGWRMALALATLLAGIVILLWSLHKQLISARWSVSLFALLSVLPVVQFWHLTSFVPEHLSTSISATTQVIGQQAEDGGARGVVDIDIRNNGDVQALVLASEVVTCFRSGPTESIEEGKLYKDRACRTDVLFPNLTELDKNSSWKIRKVFNRPPLFDSGHTIRVVQVVVFLRYARLDRLRVNSNSQQRVGWQPTCMKGAILTQYEVQGESVYKSVVQRPRRLLYLAPPPRPNGNGGDRYFALSTEGEPLCRSEDGLPKPSRYDISGHVGQRTIRIDYDDWLPEPMKR
jgi:hypothetical protein